MKFDEETKEMKRVNDLNIIENENLKALVDPDVIQMQQDFEDEKEAMRKQFDGDLKKEKSRHQDEMVLLRKQHQELLAKSTK